MEFFYRHYIISPRMLAASYMDELEFLHSSGNATSRAVLSESSLEEATVKDLN